MMIDASVRCCPNCGQPAVAAWRHCPGCGQQLKGGAVSKETAGSPIEKHALAQVSNRYCEAVLRIRLGELEQARALLTSFLQDFPQNFQSLALLGSVCLRLHRIEEACQHLERAIALAPESPFVRLKLAEYWIALGIPSRALQELARAEDYAAGDIPLLIEIRTFSKNLQDKTRGNLIREPPALPGSGILQALKRIQRSVYGEIQNKGQLT